MHNPIKSYYLVKRDRFKLVAVGASHPKLGCSINVGEARNVGVGRHSAVVFNSTPFRISKREQQLVEKQSIAIFHMHFIQSKSMQLLSTQAAFLLFGEHIFVCDILTIGSIGEGSQPL